MGFRYIHTIEITIEILYISPFCGFKALTFGLLKCHTVWRLMHISSKISNVHNDNKRAYSIFPPLRVSSERNATETIAIICVLYGENAVSHITYKRWYQKFRQGDFSLEDEPRAGRPQKIETDELQALLDINSTQTEKELKRNHAEQLGVTQQAIFVRLHTMGKVEKEGRWIPHELSENNKNRWHDTALTLLSKFRKKIFCNKIITGDEKWILYDNPKRRKSWIDAGQPSTSMPRQEGFALDLDWKGVLYYELLQPGETIMANYYQQ